MARGGGAQLPLVIELRCWRALAVEQWLDLLALQGHVVVVDAGEGADEVAHWLEAVVVEMVHGEGTTAELDHQLSLEDLGLDSLDLISLAHRLSTKSGRPVSVAELQAQPSLAALLEAVAAPGEPASAPPPPPAASGAADRKDETPAPAPAPAMTAATPRAAPSRRRRVLCLHGFRASADMLELALVPLTRSLAAAYEFVFVNAPTRATGRAEPGVPDGVPGYEWWGQPGGAYDEAWQEQYDEGFERSRARLAALTAAEDGVGFDGVIGFSQGAAMAMLVPGARWVALFSAIVPPRGSAPHADARPSFHCYDLHDPHVHLSARAQKCFVQPTVVPHGEGHAVPRAPEVVNRFAEFLRRTSL